MAEFPMFERAYKSFDYALGLASESAMLFGEIHYVVKDGDSWRVSKEMANGYYGRAYPGGRCEDWRIKPIPPIQDEGGGEVK